MTVAELIQSLQLCDPAAEVDTEGCDCIGPAFDLHLSEGGAVVVRRAKDRCCDTCGADFRAHVDSQIWDCERCQPDRSEPF